MFVGPCCQRAGSACSCLRAGKDGELIHGMDTERIPVLLLVEDSPADVKILQRALTQTGRPLDLIVLRDGQEAADYVLRQGDYAGRNNIWRRPDLIVLDLN